MLVSGSAADAQPPWPNSVTGACLGWRAAACQISGFHEEGRPKLIHTLQWQKTQLSKQDSKLIKISGVYLQLNQTPCLTF